MLDGSEVGKGDSVDNFGGACTVPGDGLKFTLLGHQILLKHNESFEKDNAGIQIMQRMKSEN